MTQCVILFVLSSWLVCSYARGGDEYRDKQAQLRTEEFYKEHISTDGQIPSKNVKLLYKSPPEFITDMGDNYLGLLFNIQTYDYVFIVYPDDVSAPVYLRVSVDQFCRGNAPVKINDI